jgi:hypothetical protein
MPAARRRAGRNVEHTRRRLAQELKTETAQQLALQSEIGQLEQKAALQGHQRELQKKMAALMAAAGSVGGQIQDLVSRKSEYLKK